MEINLIKKDDLNAVIKIKVEKEDYDEKVTGVLKDYRKKARMPGFRPGNVPMGLVKKLYGKSVMADEINKIISEKLTNYISDEDIKMLGEPMPSLEEKSDIDFENNEEFEFNFDIGLSPEFSLDFQQLSDIPYYNITIENKLVDKVVDNYKKQMGNHIDADVSEKEDIVKCHLAQIDDEGNIVEGGIKKDDASISVNFIKDPEIQDNFIGLGEGSIIDFDLKKALPSDTEISSLLDISKDNVESLDPNFRCEVTKISRFKEADVDQNLFDKIYGEGVVQNEEEFRSRIGDELKKSFAKDSDQKYLSDIKKRLLENADFDIPEKFLKRWLRSKNTKDKEISEEALEKEFPDFIKSLRWSLIKNKIIKDFNLSLEEDEIKNMARQVIAMQMRNYGMTPEMIAEGDLDGYAKEFLSKQENRNLIEEQLYDIRITTLLQNEVVPEKKEITTDEFNELTQKEKESTSQTEEINKEKEEEETEQSDKTS